MVGLSGFRRLPESRPFMKIITNSGITPSTKSIAIQIICYQIHLKLLRLLDSDCFLSQD